MIIPFDLRGARNRRRWYVPDAAHSTRHQPSAGGVHYQNRRASIPRQEHLPPGLLRLSAGIEAVEDLWTDLVQALGPNW